MCRRRGTYFFFLIFFSGGDEGDDGHRCSASVSSISRPSASVHCVNCKDRRNGFSINRPISRKPSNAHDARPTTTGSTTAGTVGARHSGSVKHHTLRKRDLCGNQNFTARSC